MNTALVPRGGKCLTRDDIESSGQFKIKDLSGIGDYNPAHNQLIPEVAIESLSSVITTSLVLQLWSAGMNIEMTDSGLRIGAEGYYEISNIEFLPFMTNVKKNISSNSFETRISTDYTGRPDGVDSAFQYRKWLAANGGAWHFKIKSIPPNIKPGKQITIAIGDTKVFNIGQDFDVSIPIDSADIVTNVQVRVKGVDEDFIW